MSENDVVLETDLASRHHARIVPSEGRYFLADLGTMNGTYMNGEAPPRRVPLAEPRRQGDDRR